MSDQQGSGVCLESISLKAGGEALSSGGPVVLSCGGVHMTYREIPTEPLRWLDIINLPGFELSKRLFGFEPVIHTKKMHQQDGIVKN